MLRSAQRRDFAPVGLVVAGISLTLLVAVAFLAISGLRSGGDRTESGAPSPRETLRDEPESHVDQLDASARKRRPASAPASASAESRQPSEEETAVDREWARLLENMSPPRSAAVPADAPIARELADRPAEAPAGDGHVATARPDAGKIASPSTDGTAPGGLAVAQAGRRGHGADFGATPFTETAVDSGLAWLAAHQDDAGTWEAVDFQQRCPNDDQCRHPAVHRLDASIRPGLTGLCLLAFLGAGYSDRSGPYQPTVAAARDALLRLQLENGAFGPDTTMSGYNDPLATLALAEFHAQVPTSQLHAALQRAVARLVSAQQALGGWDYLPAPLTARCDTSITAWVVQALLACAAAGIDVPDATLQRAALHFARAAESDGDVWYADAGEGFQLGDDLRPKFRYGPAMTAAGLLCETLLGARPDSPLLQKQRAALFSDPPSAARFRGRDPAQLHSEYYWYYGTVAMFQFGGEDWTRWNADLRDAILPLQDREQTRDGRRKHSYGSWPAFGPKWGKWGRMGGRVYTTALSVLTLETYYRHTPAYLKLALPLQAQQWQRFLANARVWERRQVARLLREARYEVGEPALISMLSDPDAPAARAAAEGLLSIGSPLGREVLAAQAEVAPGWLRDRLQKQLAEIDALLRVPLRIGRVARADAALGLVIVELPDAYIGMRLAPEPLRGHSRGGDSPERFIENPDAGELRVLRRYSGHNRVLAEWNGPAATIPAVGSQVMQQRQ